MSSFRGLTERSCCWQGQGVTSPLEETIKSFSQICDGEADDLPESAFMYVGSLDDARAKAERLAAEV